MIFDNKPIEEIIDDEIINLVRDGVQEGQDLEYKRTFYKSDNKDNKLECLRDMVSFRNADGGYIIYGIEQKNNSDKAKKFNSIEKPQDQIKKIKSWTLDYIKPRISGLDVAHRNIDGFDIIIVKIPKHDNNLYAVEYDSRTYHTKRYGTDKHDMTQIEIAQFYDSKSSQQIATPNQKNFVRPQSIDVENSEKQVPHIIIHNNYAVTAVYVAPRQLTQEEKVILFVIIAIVFLWIRIYLINNS